MSELTDLLVEPVVLQEAVPSLVLLLCPVLAEPDASKAAAGLMGSAAATDCPGATYLEENVLLEAPLLRELWFFFRSESSFAWR
jgi:hypothetical protein